MNKKLYLLVLGAASLVKGTERSVYKALSPKIG